MTRVVLAGGGLANSLIAWRLRTLRPEVPVVVVEQGATLGGNHTWSFHAGDVTPAQLAWLRPLVAHEWPGQVVRFPAFERRLDTAYYSITSERLHEALGAALGSDARLRSAIRDVRPDGVTLESGQSIGATLVIDGRGAGALPEFELRWQKFVGLELELAEPHGIDVPLLMDATVEQRDGYRFVYVLPFGSRRLLVEDTRYSDSPELRVDELREEISRYVVARGLAIASVLREETGVLPIVLDGDIDAFWNRAGDAVPRAGMAAMLCHHTTGYTLPEAAGVADLVARARDLSSAALAREIRAVALRRWREQGFFRLLNRLMFEAAEPGERYRTLEHFYRLPEPLVGRFYAGNLSLTDRLRILSGRPPVPVARALRCMMRGARASPVPRVAGQGGAT